MEGAKAEHTPGEAKAATLKPAAILVLIVIVPSLVFVLIYLKIHRGIPPAPLSIKRMEAVPKIMLWAWERPEDLGFINPRETGVAFLATTLHLKGGAVEPEPRLLPLDVPDQTALMAVARLEADRAEQPALSREQGAKAASEITRLIEIPGVSALQVDFDARESERPFYRDLILDLRRQLPDTPLSMTAPASWCLFDNWMSELPVDEVVPMLFHMGADDRQVRLRLGSAGDFDQEICRDSLGVSTDEMPSGLPSGRRVYIFCPKKWELDRARSAIDEVKRWQ